MSLAYDCNSRSRSRFRPPWIPRRSCRLDRPRCPDATRPRWSELPSSLLSPRLPSSPLPLSLSSSACSSSCTSLRGCTSLQVQLVRASLIARIGTVAPARRRRATIMTTRQEAANAARPKVKRKMLLARVTTTTAAVGVGWPCDDTGSGAAAAAGGGVL